MSLFKIFDVAGSAISAQSQRLNVVASNLANAESIAGPDGQPYKARQVVFQTQQITDEAEAEGCALYGRLGTRRRRHGFRIVTAFDRPRQFLGDPQ